MNVFVSVRLDKQNEKSIKAFEKEIYLLDEVMDCYLTTGSRDYLLRVVSTDRKTYERFIRDELTKIHGITSIECSFAFASVKSKQIYPTITKPEHDL